MSFFTSPPSDPAKPHMLAPYLTLPHLLSLTWLAYPILSLVFVAFRLQAALASSQDAIANAKQNLLSSCLAAERAATSTASMPRYMALAANEQFADAVNASLNAARSALVFSLTAMEGIINFLIDLYRSVFLCLLELIVRSGIQIMLSAVQELNNVVQNAAAGIRVALDTVFGGLESFINSIRTAASVFNIDIPAFDRPDISGLDNISLPLEFEEGIRRLNDTIPSVSTIKDKIEDIISRPFELVKAEINTTFSEISFNSATLPVPEQNRVSFCSELDLSVVDDVGNEIVKSAKIGVAILIVLALVLIGLNCLLTWYKWRSKIAHLDIVRSRWNQQTDMVTKGSHSAVPVTTLTKTNLLIIAANTEHPFVTRITNMLRDKFHLSQEKVDRLQWFFNYIFHPPAAACFMIGVFGLLCIEIQLLALGPLVNKFQERSAETVKDFSALIASSINQNMLNQSATYAAEINAQVDGIQTTLNEGLFGWVNITTTSLNTTLNEFYDDVQNAVQSVFGETILGPAATEFIRCLIGTKVDAIENAIEFLHENLRVNMPRVNETALMLSPAAVEEASTPIAAAAMGSGDSQDNQGLIARLVISYADMLRKERITFAIFLGLWGIVVLMGIAVVLWHSCGIPARRAKGQKQYDQTHRHLTPTGMTNEELRSEWLPEQKLTDVEKLSPVPSRNVSPGPDDNALAYFGNAVEVQSHADDDYDRDDPRKVSKFYSIGNKVKSALGSLKKKKEPASPPPPFQGLTTPPALRVITVNTPSDIQQTGATPDQEVKPEPLMFASRWPESQIRMEQRTPTPPSWTPTVQQRYSPRHQPTQVVPSDANANSYETVSPIAGNVGPVPLHAALEGSHRGVPGWTVANRGPADQMNLSSSKASLNEARARKGAASLPVPQMAQESNTRVLTFAQPNPFMGNGETPDVNPFISRNEGNDVNPFVGKNEAKEVNPFMAPAEVVTTSVNPSVPRVF
ncbi:hypothetical protein FA15DRAFT_755009 [Coprinopsis marcescibilis]|uniref:Plasma membrane fusion protein PRM1 n=1 Tax=Coprinopsis marcescibilis TaxID=230819 RepID=A0A5C3LDM2_COPMA|nr:hypothetical protein FA15DRAFT_755009 [Coprinopsis marcescibilis]